MPPAKKPKEGETHKKLAMKYGGVTGHVLCFTHLLLSCSICDYILGLWALGSCIMWHNMILMADYRNNISWPVLTGRN